MCQEKKMNREKKKQSLKKKKWLFGICVGISFVTFYFYNLFTPYMSDDLLFNKAAHQSIADIFRQEYISYMTHGGRSVLQVIWRVFMMFPKSVFDVCNSLCYVGTMLLLYWNVKVKKEYDIFLYVLINLCVWNFCVDFAQTMLWLTGACNYLWGLFIMLGFISIYRFYLEKGDEIESKIRAGVALFVTGLLAGWCNENTSGGAILIVLLFTAKYYYENKKVEKIMAAGVVGAFIGFAFMVLAPGNTARGALVAVHDKYSGLALYISRILKMLKAIDAYLLIYIVVICLLGTYFYYTKKYRLRDFFDVAIFVFSGLATAVVVIMTTEPMPRVYFGANMFLMIATLHMIQMIREEDTLLISLKTGGIIAAMIAMIFIYIEEGANLVRIKREVGIREAYIVEEKAKGRSELVLPALRLEFETKYSWAHYVDISNDKNNWNNDICREYYGVYPIEVLPWDEWEERIENLNGN